MQSIMLDVFSGTNFNNSVWHSCPAQSCVCAVWCEPEGEAARAARARARGENVGRGSLREKYQATNWCGESNLSDSGANC